MNQISRDKKKILVKLLCLLMIITAIQIPQREVYADEGQSITPTITRSYSGVVNKKIARTTIIEVGNTIEGKATITEVFDQQELIIGSVALNGVSVSNYKYTTNANGMNELSYTISEFNKYAATDKLKLTYETKVIDSVYEKDEATTLTNISSLYDETGNVVVSTKGSILISPNSIKQNVVIDLKQKLATWTYEINGDEIAMYAPIFTWSVNDPYLKLEDNSLTIKDGEGMNVTTSIADLNKWNFDGWVKNKDGYYSGHYGFDNTGNYKTLLNKKVIISFQTEITDDFYKENRIDYMFNVSASISWLPNAQGTDETRIKINSKENKKEKRVSYEVIKKEAVEYNESTGEITWKISLNDSDKAPIFNLTNVIITDTIESNQTFVDGSIEYETDGVSGMTSLGTETTGEYYESITKGGKTNVQIHFPSVPTKRVIFIKTKVSDAVIYQNLEDKKISNSVSIQSDYINGVQTGTKAAQLVNSNLIRKESSYDESSHTITWKLHINESHLPIIDPILTDSIPMPDALSYVKGSFQVICVNEDNAEVDDETGLNATKLNSSKPMLSYNFAKLKKDSKITDYYIITYKTQIYKAEYFYSNKDFKITNTATLAGTSGLTLTTPETTFSQSASKDQEIQIKVVTKEVDLKGNQYRIHWRVTVNRDGVVLKNASITDCFKDLPGKLELDTTNMRLIQGERTESGEWKTDENGAWVGTSIPIEASDFTYDNESKTLVFKLPEGSTSAYQLSFTSKIKDKTLKEIEAVNTAIYQNTTKNQKVITETATAMAKGKLPEDGVSVGASGSFVVTKYIKGTTTPLKNTEFALYDKYGIQVGDTKKTNEEGRVTFDDLTVGSLYTVREVAPTEGYQIDNTVYYTNLMEASNTFTAVIDRLFRISYADGLTTDITFTKVKSDVNGEGLPGAIFALYNASDAERITTLATAISDEAGKVTFSKVPYGNYVIAEISAPSGYERSNETITVTMATSKVKDTDTGEDIYQMQAVLSTEIFVNKPITGSITVTLIDEETQKPIKNGEFAIYDENGKLVTNLTTNSKGRYSTEIILGKYNVVQTRAASGYVISTDKQEVVVVITDLNKEITFTNHKIVEENIPKDETTPEDENIPKDETTPEDENIPEQDIDDKDDKTINNDNGDKENQDKDEEEGNIPDQEKKLPQSGNFFDLSVLLFLAVSLLGVGIIYEKKRKKVHKKLHR